MKKNNKKRTNINIQYVYVYKSNTHKSNTHKSNTHKSNAPTFF